MMTEDERKFREQYGHGSLCNRVRKYKGRYLVNNRRQCTCQTEAAPATPPPSAEAPGTSAEDRESWGVLRRVSMIPNPTGVDRVEMWVRDHHGSMIVLTEAEYAAIRAESRAEIARMREALAFKDAEIRELAEAREDRERLDWLERRRQALNDHYQTDYGWKFVTSHNVNRLFVRDTNTLDLNDAEPRGGDIRAAIDAARTESK